MKKQINRNQKKSISFFLCCILLMLNSCFLYDIFAECQEKYHALHSVGDCQEWICTTVDKDTEIQDTEDQMKQKNAVFHQLQAMEEINGVKGVYTIGHEWSYSEEKPESGLAIYTYDNALLSLLRYKVSEGRMPQKEDEIVLTASAKKAYSMYEKVTLYEPEDDVAVEQRKSGEDREKTYTVVGFLTQDELFTGRDYVENSITEQYLMLFQTVYEKRSDFTSFGAIALQTDGKSEMERGDVAFVQCNSQTDLNDVENSLRTMNLDYFRLQSAKETLQESPAAFLLDGGNLIREIIFFCGLILLWISVFLGEWERNSILKKGIILLLIPLIIPLWNGWCTMTGGSVVQPLHLLWLAGMGLLYLFFFGIFLLLQFFYHHDKTVS